MAGGIENQADFYTKKNQFGTFDINKLDINEVTQFGLVRALLERGFDSLLPPDSQGNPPAFGIRHIDSRGEAFPESSSEIITLFVSKKFDERLLKITNKDISHLVSFIKFARVPKDGSKLLYNEAVEFKMTTNYSKNALENILQDRQDSFGLSSLKVDVISNTGAFYAYKISMSLFFQNASILLNNSLYSSLLTMPTKDENLDPITLTMLLGWARPQMKEAVPENIKLLYEEKLPLVINLKTYNLSFNADGSVTLNMDFVGGNQSQMNSLSADVLVHKYFFEEEIKSYQESINKDKQELEGLKKTWQQLKQTTGAEIQELERKLGNSTDAKVNEQTRQEIEKKRAIFNSDEPPEEKAPDGKNPIIAKRDAEYLATTTSVSVDEFRQAYWLSKKRIQKQIDEATSQISYARYISIMRRLFYRLAVFQGKLDFKASSENSYITFQPLASSNPLAQDPEEIASRVEGTIDWGAAKNVLERKRKAGQTIYGTTANLTTSQKELIDLFTATAGGASGPNAAQAATAEAGFRPTTYGTIFFKYFFLGDLVSILTENMYSNMSLSKSDLTPMVNNHVVLGNIDVFKNEKEKISLDLAYFPISYNFFSCWYLKNVVDRDLKSYPFDQFIKDFMNDCVLNAIQNLTEWQNKFKEFTSPLSFSINRTYSDRTIELTYVDLPSQIPDFPNIKPSNLRGYISKGKVSFVGDSDIKTPLYTHVFIHGQSSYVSKSGDYKENLANGIFHFYVGSNTGILKDLKFVPINLASRYSGQVINATNEHYGKPVDEKFNTTQRYDVNITCYGFQYFRPGQLVYVDTSLLGFGKSVEPNSLARRFCLGGYYVVTQVSHTFEGNDFSTFIVAKLESFGKGS